MIQRGKHTSRDEKMKAAFLFPIPASFPMCVQVSVSVSRAWACVCMYIWRPDLILLSLSITLHFFFFFLSQDRSLILEFATLDPSPGPHARVASTSLTVLSPLAHQLSLYQGKMNVSNPCGCLPRSRADIYVNQGGGLLSHIILTGSFASSIG